MLSVLLGAYLRAAVLLLLLWSGLTVFRGRGYASASLTRGSRWLLLFSLLVSLVPLHALIFPQAFPRPPIQVFTAAGGGAAAEVTVPLLSAFPAQRVPARWVLLPAALALSGLLGVVSWVVLSYWRLWGIVEGATLIRRLGRVELRRGGAASFSAALLGRSVIVLAEDAVDPWVVTLHELTHHRRRDPQFAWLMVGLTALYCWHPAAWGLRRQLAELDEFSVDDVIRDRLGARRYGLALLHAAEIAPGAALARGMARRSLLYRRIEMLSQPRRVKSAVSLTILGALGLSAAAWAAGNLADDRRLTTSEVTALADNIDGVEVVVTPMVVDTLNRLIGRQAGRDFLRRGLAHRADYGPLVDDALDVYGLPAALAAVPLTESGYTNLGAPDIHNGPSLAPGIPGRGLWMFIPETARAYGLAVDAENGVDERLDPIAETDAAMRLLSDLYDAFNDWPLALAGYNQGASHVRQAIVDGGTRDAWALQEQGQLNHYLSHVAACMIVLESPSLVE
ncbi:MAG: transglycosylase SLT domain-containing protein [Myxococcota bacterium]